MSFWNSILEGKLAGLKFFIGVNKNDQQIEKIFFYILKGIFAENSYMWSYKYVKNTRSKRKPLRLELIPFFGNPLRSKIVAAV